MDPTLESRLAELEAKIDAVYISAEKTRKYIMWTGIVSAALFILPLIGLLFAIPSFLSGYTSNIDAASSLGV